MKRCPRCNSEATGQNRLVVDSCGHSKCRLCLLQDESYCLECKQTTAPAEQLVPLDESNDLTNTEVKTTSDHIISTEEGYRCTVCNKSFRSRTQQYYHRGCGNEDLKKYNCTQCSRRFSTRSHLKYHMNNHDVDTGNSASCSCKECGKSFKQSIVLQRHMRVHNDELHICRHCQKKFRSQNALKIHEVLHSGEDLPYKCDTCGKRYLTKANLKQHQLKHNQSTPKHSCTVCQKSFLRLSTLNLHQKRHSKRERHSCNHCYKTYSDADALARHIKQHEATSSYRCIQCDITVNRRDNMLRHLRAMHAGVSFECGVEIVQFTDDNHTFNDTEAIAAETPTPPSIRYSSVIKSVGNVDPVVIPPQPEYAQKEVADVAQSTLSDQMHKEKVKLYRKIIFDLDNEEYSNETVSCHALQETSMQQQQEQQHQQRVSTHSSSNFSEMHWRKNFKFSYENEHIN